MTDQSEPEKSQEQQRFEALAKKVLQAKPKPKAKADRPESERSTQPS